jgi:ankyrin repeat protein
MGRVHRLEQLLQEAPDVGAWPSPYGETILHFAVREGSEECVEVLVRVGGRELLNSFDDIGMSPLAVAARVGRLEVVNVLLGAGAFVDLRNEEGNDDTPLSYAVLGGHVDVVRRLLGAGADPDVKCWMGLSARDRARIESLKPGARDVSHEICKLIEEQTRRR